MVLLKIALLLLISFEPSALTFTFNTDGLQNVPNSLTANGDVCKDCTQIFELLVDLISNADLQKKIVVGIENLCSRLPDPPAKLCKDEVEKMVPIAISFITSAIKPSDVCKVIGLCSSFDKQVKVLQAFQLTVASENVSSAQSRRPQNNIILSAFWAYLISLSASVNQVQHMPTCSFCILLVKTLEDFLPKDRTEGAVIKLLEEICNILPSSYRSQCQAVVDKFSKPVLDAILSYATPEAICALLQLCKKGEAPPVDLCTQATYRCRDVKTAAKCGTLFYCQKFAWKSLGDSTL